MAWLVVTPLQLQHSNGSTLNKNGSTQCVLTPQGSIRQIENTITTLGAKIVIRESDDWERVRSSHPLYTMYMYVILS